MSLRLISVIIDGGYSPSPGSTAQGHPLFARRLLEGGLPFCDPMSNINIRLDFEIGSTPCAAFGALVMPRVFTELSRLLFVHPQYLERCL